MKKYVFALMLCLAAVRLAAQNNPSTNAIPGHMEILQIATNAIVITNYQDATLNQTVWPQGLSVRSIPGRFVEVSCPFAISNGSPYQTVVIGIVKTSTNTLVDDVGSSSESIRPQVAAYSASVTSVILWPQSPYYCELHFQISQADTISLFSTNFISTNAPQQGTYRLQLSVTASNVTILSQ
jgi:hypothetical protein